MAQNDMNIANQGFPAFRADLNDALGALVSNSSGATAPATTFAHQFWVDTSANPSVLKIRNADNDAFITVGTINQTGDTFKLTPAGGVSTDTIAELTAAAGVTIDGVLLKDTTVTANTIKASGTSASQGEVQLFEDTDNGTNYVALKAPESIASDVTFVLPNADGTTGQALVTNGSGVLSFASAGGGGYDLQVFTSPGTYTKPAGLKAVKVTVIGGGGGNVLSPSPGAGSSGGTSSFGPFLSATGGVSAPVSAGGLGSGGDINISGVNGLNTPDGRIGGGSAFGFGPPSGLGLINGFLHGGGAGGGGISNGAGGGGGSIEQIPAPSIPGPVTVTVGDGGVGTGPAPTAPSRRDGAAGIVIVEEFF